MHDPRGRGRREGERSPIRQLSSIGAKTTGWRSSLETTPRKSLGSFLIESLIAAGAFILIVFLFIWLS
jgi:hypothetical protein